MNPNDPFAWITKGDRDLTLVKIGLSASEKVPDLLCYHCQQAAEKYLKALQLHFGQEVKKTHDLEILLDLLAPCTVVIDVETYDKALTIKTMLSKFVTLTLLTTQLKLMSWRLLRRLNILEIWFMGFYRQTSERNFEQLVILN